MKSEAKGYEAKAVLECRSSKCNDNRRNPGVLLAITLHSNTMLKSYHIGFLHYEAEFVKRNSEWADCEPYIVENLCMYEPHIVENLCMFVDHFHSNGFMKL